MRKGRLLMAWLVDYSRSRIQFSVRHLMFSKVRGVFESFEATVDFEESAPEKSTVSVLVDTASVNTRDRMRDGQLRSADFFNVESYPKATFVGTRIKQIAKNKGQISGPLTIGGRSENVVLNVIHLGTAAAANGVRAANFTAAATLDRRDWGLEWKLGLDTGGVLASWTVELDVKLRLLADHR